jgi:DNA-binding MarR family transcriptional regulator
VVIPAAVAPAEAGPADDLARRAAGVVPTHHRPGERPGRDGGTEPRHKSGPAQGAQQGTGQDGAERHCEAGRVNRHHSAQEFLPDLLARASHVAVEGFAAALRERGVSLPVWRVMAALSARPGESVTRLAEVCLLQQPTTTKLLDRMARDGLVARVPDARDRRIVRVALTPEGEAMAAGLLALAGRHEAEVLARHPQADAVKPVLRDIVARFGSTPQPVRGEEDDRDEEDA